ncbi:hypothetical protein PACILC2_37760 [Paenibacillus cisolokensis]|uniref:Regulatory protein RecX n=1 Tax=Paenibacillus cisolokensis TaxID=1658519 RepID=A0ABQ4NB85_9BACL|nr:RecX family transcriptional regulator [Paenibacillus cisolokensis]GIQ65208.1 hypothetical protein PACILC2_37760 [Paenibacillus cisolokensis]
MKERPGGHERPAVITAVKQDRKERRRYHIYIDGADEAALSVHEDIMVRYRLLKGQTVDPAVLDEIRGEDDKYRCYMAALVYLGVKPRTRKEVERYLLRKGMEAGAVALTLDRLERERLVDDRDYAGLFAGQRLRSAGKGRRLIVQELRQRGVKGETAAEAADALDPAEELEVALALAVKNGGRCAASRASGAASSPNFCCAADFRAISCAKRCAGLPKMGTTTCHGLTIDFRKS